MKRAAKLVTIAILGWLVGGGARAEAAGPPCTDTEWLIKAYGDLLFRPPAPSEVAAWIDPNTHLLTLGADRFEAAWAIATSNEGIGYLLGLYPHTVAGYFQDVLGRAPQGAEFQTFYGTLGFPQGNAADYALLSLLIGGSLAQYQYANEFAAHADAANPGLDICSPRFAEVNQIFEVYMGRSATQAELDHWSGLLDTGTPLQTVALGISGTLDLDVGQGTGEYFNRVVREAFARFYRRSPGPDELVSWSNALAQNGLNQELWAVLMSADEYCSGVAQISVAELPPPPANVAPLQVSVAGTPQVYSVAGPIQPLQVADGIQVLSVQQHVVAQNAVIAQLGGDVVPCPPDKVCIGATAVTPAQVIIDLIAQVGSLSTQVALQGSTLAQQQSTIVSLVNNDFGLPVNLADASAARAVAAQQIQAAAAVATTRAAQVAVEHAQMKFQAGDSALQEGFADQALRDYKDAFKDALRSTM